jgi:hypothetical protein
MDKPKLIWVLCEGTHPERDFCNDCKHNMPYQTEDKGPDQTYNTCDKCGKDDLRHTYNMKEYI